MNTKVQAEASTGTPAVQDQSSTTIFHVETMTDLDTGQPTLVSSTQGNHGDLQVVTADQVLNEAGKAHKKIDDAVRLALQFQAATTPTPPAPTTWTFTDRDTGAHRTVTCIAGCTTDHQHSIDNPVFSEDVYCWNTDSSEPRTLPVNETGTPEDLYVLSTVIACEPFSDKPARRIPHARVEILEDHFIEDLDPDGLQAVIGTVEQRLTAMRQRHAELIRIRNEHLGRQA
ncbi:DUF6907 domain-containing protein [Streptomyces sp. P9-A2]|uniref:DUF6907 domain-containing protein n=1 Tax=Streptomyces sp. P9-A2 TaxID=3072284 RepID=UPI002FC6DCCD